MNSPSKWRDTPEQAEARAAAVCIAWKKQADALRNQTDLVTGTLSEVIERGLWKLKYASPREWLENRCGITKQWANQILSTHRTIEEIQESSKWKLVSTSDSENKAILQKMTPKQRGALDGLPTEQKAEVFQKSIEAAGGLSPTPKLIEQVRKETVKNGPTAKEKPTEPDTLTDETGLTVPKELIPLWERASEVSDVMAQIQRVKRTLTEAQKSDDLLWSRLNFDNVKNELTAAWFAIQDLLPYAVCPTCQGRMPKNCLHCKRRGFIGKYTWDHTVTIEIKAIRTKVVATQK